MNKLLLAISFLIPFTAIAQINVQDSTVQTIGYWDKLEKQSYTVSENNISLKGPDTTSKYLMKYEVEINVLDSTDKSYTVEWFYKNYSIETNNDFMKKLMSLAENMKVKIKTDENGSFTEVVNWKDISSYVKKSIDKLKTELKDLPKLDAIIKQMEETYSSKEAIESVAVKEIQQFYMFHGGKYKLSEIVEGKVKVPNMFGGEPFDSDFTLSLDEINAEDNNYVMRAEQTVNKEQLKQAAFNYTVALSKKMGIDPPKLDDFDDFKNETTTAARIHSSGWILYNSQVQTVTTDDVTKIEERVIEIK